MFSLVFNRFVLFFIILLVFGLYSVTLPDPLVLGGSNENLIIDTLNMVHWLKRNEDAKIFICDVIKAIDDTAPILKQHYSGRVMYIIKDRDNSADERETQLRHALYAQAVVRNKIFIYSVERLPDDYNKKTVTHSAKERDDFYIILLAHKLHCSVLSRDRYRDLADMKKDVNKFHVNIFSPLSPLLTHDYVNPNALEYKYLKRPQLIDYSKFFPNF